MESFKFSGENSLFNFGGVIFLVISWNISPGRRFLLFFFVALCMDSSLNLPEALANYGKEKQNILRKLEVRDLDPRKVVETNHQPPFQTLENLVIQSNLFGG